jgi:hypothetical protein
MSHKDTAFYRGNKQINFDFSAEEISSDGAVLLLEKLEREHKLIDHFSKVIPDLRDPSRITHSINKLLKQRVYGIMLGYEDANDVDYLKNDPLLQDVLEGELASQPTISRFENTMNKHTIFELCYAWVDQYVNTLKNRKKIIIDIDATDDPTHGNQQLSMFNGFYGQFMYNELFFHDGETGQIILPVLRPGNSHSNKWYVAILKRVLIKIKEKYPDIEIIIRADSGFSGPAFYKLADKFKLKYTIGQASNEVLKRQISRCVKAVLHLFVSNNIKHQHFTSFEYQAKSWDKAQRCYSKIESTGKGLNVRHFISNMDEKDARSLYFDFYVKRGDASENRIKEVKNMCYSDRLSNHAFWANFMRLILSSLAYEMFLLIKQGIKRTKYEVAKKWQVSTIRVALLKVGGTIKKTKRRIYYRFSRAFVHQDLLRELILQ